jgi:hypothetical protein
MGASALKYRSEESASPDDAWENQFLNWFSSLGIPTFERKHQLGAFAYHYFETAFVTPDGRPCSTHGRAQDRKLAAIKAIAEYAERRFMTEFFMTDSAAKDFSRSFRTSNGWAVHQSQNAAEIAAISEALERHLLLKAYCKHGWNGFKLIQKIEADGMDLFFLLSRVTAGGKAAGLVAAKSKLYPGISFGYCLGDLSEFCAMRFWESALFEAVDKIILLKGMPIDLSLDPASWLLAEVKHYLETPFDVDAFSSTTGELIESPLPAPALMHFDLKKKWDLEFPLHAAFAHGGGLIPLFSAGKLSSEEQETLGKILAVNGVDEIPERHPIL